MCTGHADSMFTRSDCACFMAPNRTISTGCSNYLIRITWRTNNRFLDFAIRVLRSRLCRVGFTCDNDFFWFFYLRAFTRSLQFSVASMGKKFNLTGSLFVLVCPLRRQSRALCSVHTAGSNRFFIHDSKRHSLVIEVQRIILLSWMKFQLLSTLTSPVIYCNDSLNIYY